MEEKTLWQKVVGLSQYIDNDMWNETVYWSFLDEKTIKLTSNPNSSLDLQSGIFQYLLNTGWTFCTRNENDLGKFEYTFTDAQSNYLFYYCDKYSDYLYSISQNWTDLFEEGDWVNYLTKQERENYEKLLEE